jgi:large subunit ribosomal protein L28
MLPKAPFTLFSLLYIIKGSISDYAPKGRFIMSRTCDICGKHTVTGNKVSHAKNHTRRTWKPNLVKVKTEVKGTTLTLKICTRCLRSDFITKKV